MMEFHIAKVLSVVACVFFASSTASAQSVSLPYVDMSGPYAGASNLSAAQSLANSYMQQPPEDNSLVKLGTATASGASPAFNVLVNDGLPAVPGAVLNGTTLITPRLQPVPATPVVNRPLPGL